MGHIPDREILRVHAMSRNYSDVEEKVIFYKTHVCQKVSFKKLVVLSFNCVVSLICFTVSQFKILYVYMFVYIDLCIYVCMYL